MLEVLFFSLVILVASTIGTVAGFGSSTVLLPVLLLFIPYIPAQFFVAFLHVFGDIWKIILFRKAKYSPWLLILSFAIAGSIASVYGATISVRAPEILFRLLGFFLLLYTVLIFWEPKFKIKPAPQIAIAGGALSGFCAGLFGIRGAIRSAFLHAFGFTPYAYLFATGATSLPIDIARIIGYINGGGVPMAFPLYSIPFYLIASLCGALLGKQLVSRLKAEFFRRFVALLLALLALRLILL